MSSVMKAPKGILLMDKPKGISSHGVVGKMRRHLNTKTIGHTGTLDPMATGLLVLLVGEYTRLSNYIMAQDKIYEAEITFGRSTDTDDAEGETLEEVQMPVIERSALEKVLPQFVGIQMQTPPVFSAISIDGERLYKKARRGEKIEVPPRQIEIMDIQLLALQAHQCSLRIHCSKGTYIRSVARDLGRALGGLAHLSGLRRVRTGCFDISQSVDLETPVEQMLAQMNNIKKRDLGLPVFDLEREQARDFVYGKVIPKANFIGLPTSMPALACFGNEIWAIVDEKDGNVVVKRGFGKQIKDLEVL